MMIFKLKAMKKTILIISILLYSYSIFAQVGGISNSKIIVIGTDPVPLHDFEFEPAFNIFWGDKAWDQDKKSYDLFMTNDEAFTASDFGFRFTYGLFNNVEIGVSASSDASETAWGIKYNFLNKNKFASAFALGLNLQHENIIYNKKEQAPSIAGAYIFAIKPTEGLCLETDIQMQKYVRNLSIEHSIDLFITSELAYYINDNIQLAFGVSYMQSKFKESNNNIELLSIYPGATIEFGETFVIILGLPFDISGRNIEQTIGLGIAITFAIN